MQFSVFFCVMVQFTQPLGEDNALRLGRFTIGSKVGHSCKDISTNDPTPLNPPPIHSYLLVSLLLNFNMLIQSIKTDLKKSNVVKIIKNLISSTACQNHIPINKTSLINFHSLVKNILLVNIAKSSNFLAKGMKVTNV